MACQLPSHSSWHRFCTWFTLNTICLWVRLLFLFKIVALTYLKLCKHAVALLVSLYFWLFMIKNVDIQRNGFTLFWFFMIKNVDIRHVGFTLFLIFCDGKCWYSTCWFHFIFDFLWWKMLVSLSIQRPSSFMVVNVLHMIFNFCHFFCTNPNSLLCFVTVT